MFAQLLESRTHLQVERRLGLAGTQVCFEALKNGAIDVYPEYTGTGLVSILGEKAQGGPDADAQPGARRVPPPLERLVAGAARLRELVGDRRAARAGRARAPRHHHRPRAGLEAPPRRLRPRVRGAGRRPPRPPEGLRPRVRQDRPPPAGDPVPGGPPALDRRARRLLDRRPADPLQPQGAARRPPLLPPLRGGGAGARRDAQAPPRGRRHPRPPRRRAQRGRHARPTTCASRRSTRAR